MAGLGAAPVSFMGANPALIRQALAMQGHDPSIMDEISREPPPPAEAAPQMPMSSPVSIAPAPATNAIDRALETVGSSYRLPREEPAVAPTTSAPSSPPETSQAPAPTPPAISDQAFNPKAGTRQLRSEVIAGINEKMGLQTEQGEIGAEKAERQAEQFGKLSEEQRGGLNEAKVALEENRKRRARLEKHSDEALDAMSEAIKHPPDTTKGRALSIVASVVGMFPGGGGIAGGLQSLRHAMAEDMQAYQAKVGNNADAAKTFAAMAGAEDDESESRLRQQQMVGTMTAATYDSALRQIEKEAESDEARRAAQELRLGVRQTAAEGTIRADEQRAAAAAARARKGAMSEEDTAIIRAIAGAPTPQAAKAIASNFGDHGLELLGKVQKGDVTQAGLEKTAADTEKALAEAAKEHGLEGRAAKLTEGEQKRDAVVAGAVDAYNRMNKLVNVAGSQVNRGAIRETWVPDVFTSETSLQQRADVENMVRSILRVESGSNVPDNEVQGKIRALGIDSGDPAVRATGMKQLLQGFKALDVTGRLTPKPESEDKPPVPGQAGFSQRADTQAAARRAVSQQGRVAMVNPKTGDTQMVRPDLVQAFQAKDYIVNAVPAEAPPPEAQPAAAAPPATQRWPGAMGS